MPLDLNGVTLNGASGFAFNPVSLFAAGTQGAFYDPSDLNTLFQDDAGTTPVTAVEQTVGRILDKSGRGNHATQATLANRPTLRARYNLLTFSEQFDNAAWTKFNATVTANAATAPDGTSTADKYVTENGSAAGNASLRQDVACVASTRYTLSIYVKASGQNSVDVRFITRQTVGGTFIGDQQLVVNLTNGTYTTTTAGTPPSSPELSVVSLGDGWYRVVISAITNNNALGLRLTVTNAVTGNGTDGVLVWGAQIVATNTFPQNTYQRIAAATDYATGAAFPPYLDFDGSNDSMATASIDFTATDEMSVFAGVTKNSDAANAIVVELSASRPDNNGAFTMLAPGGAVAGTSKYDFVSKGTGQSSAATTSASFNAPVTNVITGLSDISLDSSILRVNGTQVATSSTDQGTGNFGNYPLYIGARGGTSAFFNGRLYSLIVLGRTATAGEITSTEQWVAGKTGITI